MFDIPSVFPQTFAKDIIFTEILRKNIIVNDELFSHLVQRGVFTDSMVDEIKVC